MVDVFSQVRETLMLNCWIFKASICHSSAYSQFAILTIGATSCSN